MNIVLIGMPGSGKSTVGKHLAEMLKMGFIDTDSIIQETVKKPLKEVVSQEGLEKFLEIQGEVISKLDVDNTIISTGGSCIYNQDAMEHLKKNGKVIYLKAAYQELENRFSSGRRLARRTGQSFADIYNERAPLYEKHSDYTVDCSGKTVEEIADEINGIINNLI